MIQDCRRQIKKNLEQKRELKEMEISYMLTGKTMVIF